MAVYVISDCLGWDEAAAAYRAGGQFAAVDQVVDALAGDTAKEGAGLVEGIGYAVGDRGV